MHKPPLPGFSVINKDKSEYITMNDSGTQMRWTPSEQHPLGIPMNRTGVYGPTKKRKDVKDNRTLKYLGVHFDALAGWNTQLRVLQEKHGKLISNLKYASVTPNEAVYCINCKIIPAVIYPLQVATVTKSVLEKWDKSHQNIL